MVNIIMDCVFCKIRDREIPKEFTYEDDDIMVFPDIHPVRPVHMLIVPKIHVEDFLDFNDGSLMSKAKTVMGKIIRDTGLDKKGYRVGINGGGAQLINHVHFHVSGPIGKGDNI
ncbi:MAG: HIT domain-containing protein [Patescibacteria group bacterium]|nr:HIT domain-containing protein [Patescibacteria group bacterium]